MKLTLEELKQYDGKDGKPSYIAVKGKIYDVTNSKLWPKGKHAGRFTAGNDLTKELGGAPHGMESVERFPLIGEIKEIVTAPNDSLNDDGKLIKYRELYAKYHPHPMMVHFPMGILVFSFFIQILNIFFGGNIYLVYTSVASMAVGTLSIVPAVLSGYLSMWLNYKFKSNIYLKRKITGSFISLILGCYASYRGSTILYYELCPTAINEGNKVIVNYIDWVYTIISFLIILSLTSIGFNGGKLTWGD